LGFLASVGLAGLSKLPGRRALAWALRPAMAWPRVRAAL
jgi:hypothetical protein